MQYGAGPRLIVNAQCQGHSLWKRIVIEVAKIDIRRAIRQGHRRTRKGSLTCCSQGGTRNGRLREMHHMRAENFANHIYIATLNV